MDCHKKVYVPPEDSSSRTRLLFCGSSALEGDVARAFQHISYVHATIFYSSIYEEAGFLIAYMKIFFSCRGNFLAQDKNQRGCYFPSLKRLCL